MSKDLACLAGNHTDLQDGALMEYFRMEYSDRFARETWGLGCQTASTEAELKTEVNNCFFEAISRLYNRTVCLSNLHFIVSFCL